MIDYYIKIKETHLFNLMIDYLKIQADIFTIIEDTDEEQGYENYVKKYGGDPGTYQNEVIARLEPYEVEKRKTNRWNETGSSVTKTQRFYKCSGPSLRALLTGKEVDTFLDLPFDIGFFQKKEYVLYDVVHEEYICINRQFWEPFFKKNKEYLECIWPIPKRKW